MDNSKQTPEASHVHSREAAESLNNPDTAIRNLENSMVAYLGGAEAGAHYADYPSDHALRTTKVERTGGKVEDGWVILGEAMNQAGAKVFKVGRLDDNGRLLAKPATPEQLAVWNTPETRKPEVIQQNLGRIGLRLGGGESTAPNPLEIIDAPVEQLDEPS